MSAPRTLLDPHAVSTSVFTNGNSQAVRIPREFRLNCKQVEICRNADGDLVLHPLLATSEKRGDALLQTLAGFDSAFADVLEEDRRSPPEEENREPL